MIRQSLQIVLEMKEGIEVTATAKDGREVIQEVRKDKPDVILMDVRMPQSNYDTSIHAQNVEEITDAEWEIIKLVGRGMSNKEISTELNLSEGTVRNYLSTILSKLDLRDRTQLAIWEVQSGSAKYGRR